MNSRQIGIARLVALAILGGVAIALAAALAIALASVAGRGDLTPSQRKGLALFAAVAGVLLVLMVLCFALFAIHLLSQRLTIRQERRGPTAYSNAWEIAGQRLKLNDADEPEPPGKDA